MLFLIAFILKFNIYFLFLRSSEELLFSSISIIFSFVLCFTEEILLISVFSHLLISSGFSSKKFLANVLLFKNALLSILFNTLKE